MADMTGSVTVHADAPLERVWALVSDITQIGRFSPDTFEAEWIDGGMRRTLERVEAAAESEAGAGDQASG